MFSIARLLIFLDLFCLSVVRTSFIQVASLNIACINSGNVLNFFMTATAIAALTFGICASIISPMLLGVMLSFFTFLITWQYCLEVV